MNSVNNIVPIHYTAADVGVLTPPDYIKRFKGVTDYELEQKFRKTNKDVYSKQKHISFEDRKKTPALLKIILGSGLVIALWKLAKHFIKK